MEQPRFTVIGCVVEDAARECRWGLVIHSSHGGLVRGNVFMGAREACLVTEAGDESRNTIEGNIFLDSDTDGAWFNGIHKSVIRGNVAAGCGRDGFYFAPHLSDGTRTVPAPCGCKEGN